MRHVFRGLKRGQSLMELQEHVLSDVLAVRPGNQVADETEQRPLISDYQEPKRLRVAREDAPNDFEVLVHVAAPGSRCPS